MEHKTKKSKIDERKEGMTKLLDYLAEKFGDGAGQPMTHAKLVKLPRFSTGSIMLDEKLGGGMPKGRIAEIYGVESSGKTTLTLQIIAQAQKQGMTTAFIDMEHALDPEWATALGVDMDTMLFHQPEYGEQAMEMVRSMVDSGVIDLIVVDSVAALIPKAEVEGEIGEQHMGRHAKFMSQIMRMLNPLAAKKQCTILFINQTRSKIGIVFGNPETTPGGHALKFYSSIRISVSREGVKDSDERVGDKVKLHIVKNKTATPFQKVELKLLYGIGFDLVNEALDIFLEKGYITKSGAWYKMDGNNVAQGEANMVQWLRNNPDTHKTLLARLDKTEEK